jgi:hypothetical protein
MRRRHCHNFDDFRALAKRRLPGAIFDYIDGAADDEVTHRRNLAAFDQCDLVPNVLRGVAAFDLSVSVMGQRLAMPVYCSPTALQRLFHYRGEYAVAAAAAKFSTMRLIARNGQQAPFGTWLSEPPTVRGSTAPEHWQNSSLITVHRQGRTPDQGAIFNAD